MALAKPGSKPSDKKSDGKADSKAQKTGQKDIMPPGDMREVINAARQGVAATCAFGQTTDHDGVLMMDRRLSPKKLLATLKTKAGKAGVKLDQSGLRFGRIKVGGSGHVTFVVNRETSPNMRPKLLEHLKEIGCNHLEILTDLSIESEPEDGPAPAEAAAAASGPARPQPGGDAQPAAEDADQRAAATQDPSSDDRSSREQAQAEPAADAGAAGGATSAPGDAAADAAASGGAAQASASPSARTQSDAADAPQDRAAADAATAGGSAEASAASPAQPPPEAAALTRTLGELVKRMQEAVAANPAQEGMLRPLALQAGLAIRQGDLDAARKALDALRNMLGTEAAASGAATNGAAANGSAAGSAANGAGNGEASGVSPASQRTIANARMAWIATRKRVETELDKLHDAFADAFKGHHMEGDLTSVFRERVDTVLDALDENLADMLDDLNNATDATRRAALVKDAHALIGRYIKHIDQDDTIKELDGNPFVPLSIRKTMETTLGTLSRAIR